MRTKWMKTAVIAISAALGAGTASADLIAGWDFSQYRGSGSLDSGAGPEDTLPANYSALDATGAAGAESAFYGTMFMDGTNGSTDVNESAASPGPTVVPIARNTHANRKAPLEVATNVTSFPTNAFDALNHLRGEGQVNQSRVALTARSSEDLVFQVNKTATITADWGVRFAGYTTRFATGSVDVDVEFAPDCASYSFVSTETLTTEQQEFDVDLTPGGSIVDDQVCVKLALDATNGQPIIDNVAVYIQAPEPGALASMGAGLLMLVLLARLRRS